MNLRVNAVVPTNGTFEVFTLPSSEANVIIHPQTGTSDIALVKISKGVTGTPSFSRADRFREDIYTSSPTQFL